VRQHPLSENVVEDHSFRDLLDTWPTVHIRVATLGKRVGIEIVHVYTSAGVEEFRLMI
jgi:hypothetical protein